MRVFQMCGIVVNLPKFMVIVMCYYFYNIKMSLKNEKKKDATEINMQYLFRNLKNPPKKILTLS